VRLVPQVLLEQLVLAEALVPLEPQGHLVRLDHQEAVEALEHQDLLE